MQKLSRWLLNLVGIAFFSAVLGCGDNGPTGTVQPPAVDKTPPPSGQVVEPASSDEK